MPLVRPSAMIGRGMFVQVKLLICRHLIMVVEIIGDFRHFRQY